MSKENKNKNKPKGENDAPSPVSDSLSADVSEEIQGQMKETTSSASSNDDKGMSRAELVQDVCKS